MGEGTLAQAALKLFTVAARPSPQVEPAPPPAPAPGDTGYYACTKLAGDEFAAAIGRSFKGPRPNGGKAASNGQPPKSNCAYESQTSDPASGMSLYLTIATYDSVAAASQGFVSDYGFTPAANIAGIGDGAFIFPNGTPAYVLVGADVAELTLTVPPGTDLTGLYTTLMRDIAGHANNPAPTPTPPVPGPDDLDPCLLTPAEVQTIFYSGPVTAHRAFADDSRDFACVYLLIPSLQYSITIDTVGHDALAAGPTGLQDRYSADRQSFDGATDIPGFGLPSAPAAAGVADLWGFGNDSYVEIADHGPAEAAGGSTSSPMPPNPLILDFPDPIPNLAGSGPRSVGYLASIIPTPGLTPSSTCGTSGVRCAADAHFSVTGAGENLNQ